MDIKAHVEDLELRKFLHNRGKELGLRKADDPTFGHNSWVALSDYDGAVGRLNGVSSESAAKVVDIPTLLKAMNEKPIHVAGYVVGFKNGCVKIGCTTIDAELIEAIYKRFKETN